MAAVAHVHDSIEITVHAITTSLCPGFRAHHAERTETSLLLSGVLDGRDVIAKYPTDRRPFWLARAHHEIAVYRALPRLTPVPVTTPRLVAANPDHHLLVITRIPGHPVHPSRYATSAIPADQLHAVIEQLERLHRWQPAAPDAIPIDDDYHRHLDAVRGTAITDTEYHHALAVRTTIAGQVPHEIQHGDAHLANVIRQHNHQLALIDLEFTSWRTPGHDLAVLWVLLGDAPGARDQLLSRIRAGRAHHAAFWTSALLVCLREITSQQRTASGATHHQRLTRLHRDLNTILNRIRTYSTTQFACPGGRP